VQRVALAGIAVVATLFASPALATFPGKNGRIAYTALKNGLHTLFLTESGALTPHTAWYYDFEPAVSPDGSQIAFARLAGGKRSILAIASDGSGLHAVASADTFGDGAQLGSPAWSRDGKLSFVVGAPPPNGGIWTLAKGQLTHTIENSDVREPNWSP